MNPKDVKWGPAPPIFAKGAQIAVLSGDPSKAGPFVIRLKVPAGYQDSVAEYYRKLSGAGH